MSKRPRRNHSAAFKAKGALEALRDGKTIVEVAQKHDVHPNQVTDWRSIAAPTRKAGLRAAIKAVAISASSAGLGRNARLTRRGWTQSVDARQSSAGTDTSTGPRGGIIAKY